MARAIDVPRLVVAGASSGAGKTTAVVALAEAFRARGLEVAAFKCGPDFLDPTYHARATGMPSQNLDGWMMGRDAVRETFARAAEGADLAIVEGVMGLFDGASPDSDEGSTAQIAKWLGAPVVLVIDASGMARTFAPLVLGLARFDPELRVAGAIANRVGSRSHLELLGRASRGAVTVLGGLPEEGELAFPERHLGLVTAEASVVPDDRLRAWGAVATEWFDLDAIVELARSAPSLPIDVEGNAGASARRCRIAIARDEAFHFYYPDNLRRLEALGAELVPFSPLSASALPEETHGLYVGGGYPELFAAPLSRNGALGASIRDFASKGGPVYAECGGLMFLAQAIRTLDGREHPMVGLLPGVAAMAERLQALGYVEVETTRRSILGEAGLRFRGHQFRYSRLEGAPEVELSYRVRKRRGGEVQAEGYGGGSVLASYVHAHWASNPRIAEGLVAACVRFGAGS